MEGQMNINPTALDSVVIQANYRLGKGWDASFTTRRNGDTWAGGERRLYDLLTTDELAQVICDEVARAFGL